MKKILILSVIVSIIVGCNKAVITPTVLPSDDNIETPTKAKPNNRPVYYAEGDTAVYVIAFSDKKEYKGFRKKFDELFKSYAFDTLKTDTVNQYFQMVLSGKAEVMAEDSLEEKMDSLVAEEILDTLPKRFGKVKIYTAEGFTDEIFDLLTATPFSYKTTMQFIDSSESTDSIGNKNSIEIHDTDVVISRLEVKQLTSRLYTIFLDSTLKTSEGVSVSAFDIANSWNAFLKNCPASARSLFRNVKGAKAMVMGTEAVVQGFKIRDKYRIDIQMAAPDTNFAKQIMSSKALSLLFNTGTYAVTSDENGVVSLKYNDYSKGGFALADEYVLFQKKDKNPLISFSQKKYDVVPFFQKKDLQYAKKLERNGAAIEELEEEVCFLVLGTKNEIGRKYLKTIIDPARIMTTAIMGEGEIYAKDTVGDEQLFLESESVRIIYRSDLPVQVKTAEKIFADLKQASILSELSPLDKKSYEKEIVGRKFDVAVCTELKRVMNNPSEELFLAGKYFGSMKPLDVLIEESRLFPLFNLKRYALCAENVKVFEKRVDGIHRIESQAEQASIPDAE